MATRAPIRCRAQNDPATRPQCIETVLKDKQYEEAKVPLWVDLICDGCMKSLTELNKPFKYIVSCIIMQRNGAGIHTAQSCHWDIRSVPLLHVACPS